MNIDPGTRVFPPAQRTGTSETDLMARKPHSPSYPTFRDLAASSNPPDRHELPLDARDLSHIPKLQIGEIRAGASAQVYSLELEIGQDALAFEARPIVGPASVELGSEAEGMQHALPLAIELAQTAAAPELWIGRSRWTSPDQLGDDGPPVVHHQRGVGRAADFSNPGATAKLTARGVGAGSTPLRPEADGLRRIDEARIRNHSPISRQDAATQRFLAQLVAASGEYRVTLRGIRLSGIERDQLAAAIRSALRSYGFADRPIMIANPAGGV